MVQSILARVHRESSNTWRQITDTASLRASRLGGETRRGTPLPGRGVLGQPHLVVRSEQVKEDRLVYPPLLAEFKGVSMNRGFGVIICLNVVPDAAGGQNVQNVVEQPAGVTPGPTNVWLSCRKVFRDN